MGETAEMMIEGILCQQCGVYIEEGEAQGFPRYCPSCNPRRKERIMERILKKNGIKRDGSKIKPPTTGENAVRGVKNFLKGKVDEEDFNVIIGRYSDELKMPDVSISTPVDVVIISICNEIQKDFSRFVVWFKKTYKNK